MFDKYSAVTSEDKYPFLDYREVVMARKKPRDILAQANTVIDSKYYHETYKLSNNKLYSFSLLIYFLVQYYCRRNIYILLYVIA